MRIALEVLAAVIGTLAFCIFFAIPKKYFAVCGFIGGMGWLIYRLMIMIPVSDFLASLAATVVITLLSRISAVRTRTPSTIYLLPGILPLIPGGGIYRTVFYLVNDEISAAVSSGISSIKIVVAIVLAIVFVFEIPQKVFSSKKDR